MPGSVRILVLSVAVAFVTAITWFGIFTLVNAYVTRGLGGTDAQWAAATLWLTGGMVIWQILAAPIANALGRARAMTLALLMGALAYAVIATTRSTQVIGMMLGLMGIAQAMTFVVFFPILAQAGGEKPGRALALYQWIVTVVTVASIVTGGVLVDRGIYGPVFLGIAALSTLCAIVFAVFCPRESAAAVARPTKGLHNASRADYRALGGPFLIVLALGLCVEPFYYHMINQLYPNLARQHFGMGEASIASVVALGRLPSLLTIAFVAQRIDKGNPVAYYGVGIIASASMAIATAWAPAQAWGVGLYLAYYLCHGVVWGSNIAAANASVPPRLRELAFTLLCLCQAALAYAAGWLHQQMLDHGLSLRAVYTVSGSIALSGGVVLLIYAVWFRRGVGAEALVGAPAGAPGPGEAGATAQEVR